MPITQHHSGTYARSVHDTSVDQRGNPRIDLLTFLMLLIWPRLLWHLLI